jgi:hypothetical protein
MDLEVSKVEVQSYHQTHAGLVSVILKNSRFNYALHYARAPARAES